jgi:ATP-binding cassette subfamily B protein
MGILDKIYAPENNWTIVDISHDSEVVLRSSRVDVLDGGRIVESGTPYDLANQESSAFRELFPFLTARVLAERASQ